MAFSYAHSVAVVTGAASGIGAALSAALAGRGADLALVDRNADGLRRVAEAAGAAGRRISQHVLDITDRAAVAELPRAVLALHGRVSILINNAGVALGGTFEQIQPEDFDWLMDVNFGGTVRMTRGFLPLLRRESPAALVNISSLFGLIAPPGQTAYAASKFAVRGFTEALRHELAGTAVRVICVHPGGVATPIARSARRPAGVDDRTVEQEISIIERLLAMPPAEAAEIILRGIEEAKPRVLVGKDAKRGDVVQRLFPASYMKRMARSLERTRRAAGVQVAARRTEATPVAERASLQAHAVDAIIRLTVKRRMSRARDPKRMREALEETRIKLPKPAIFTAAALGGVPGEWVSWEGVTPTATLLYLHGGGYFACSPRTHRPITSGFARRGLNVFAPDYRLAPEHPFPAAIDDAVAVWRALLARAPGEKPPFVGGDSAGGGLTLALALKLRDLGEALPSGLVLLSPWTDLTLSGVSIEGNARRDALFTLEGLRRGPSIYLAGMEAKDPLASPVLADLRGLPPMLIHVGAREMLLDDSTRLAERARAAGVQVELAVWPVVPHVWQIVPWLPEAARSLDQAAAFMMAQPGSMRVAA